MAFITAANTIPATALAVLYLLSCCCFHGKGEEFEDPPEIVAKALLCFNDKYIYSACDESCRLNESGDLVVAAEKTDEYCNGACLAETHLVLDCLDGIFSNFLFYNRATIHDVRDTIHAGCGYGPQRGNFDVTAHIKAERGRACRISNQIGLGLGFMILGLFIHKTM